MIFLVEHVTIGAHHWPEITKSLGCSLGVPMACQVRSAVVLQKQFLKK
jgi:hypothetical protein